jgi:type IV secretory pathway protease TraF
LSAGVVPVVGRFSNACSSWTGGLFSTSRPSSPSDSASLVWISPPRKKMVHVDRLVVIGHDHASLDEVLQFPDVAGKVIAQ